MCAFGNRAHPRTLPLRGLTANKRATGPSALSFGSLKILTYKGERLSAGLRQPFRVSRSASAVLRQPFSISLRPARRQFEISKALDMHPQKSTGQSRMSSGDERASLPPEGSSTLEQELPCCDATKLRRTLRRLRAYSAL